MTESTLHNENHVFFSMYLYLQHGVYMQQIVKLPPTSHNMKVMTLPQTLYGFVLDSGMEM